MGSANTDFGDYEAAFSETNNKEVDSVKEVESMKEVESVLDHYDEEEFEGFENFIPPPPPAAATKETTSSPIKPTNDQKENVEAKKFSWKDKDWTMEVSYGAVIICYLLIMVVGKYRNSSIAQRWLKEYVNLYKSNFYLVGHGSDLIVQESNSSFTLKATGRMHCKGAHTEISLVKRHDLLSLLWGVLYPTKDVVTITFPMNSSDMNPFVFAVVSSSAKSFVKEHKDLEITSKRSTGLVSNLECYTDASDLTSSILNSEILEILNENSDLIDWIYITDVHPYYVNSNIFEVRFKIPTDVSKMEKLMKLTFLLVDFLPSVQLSKTNAASIQKIRKKLIAKTLKEVNQQRQELSAQKREEEKKEKISKMTPEELEKFKDKQEKKILRKLMTKQSKKVVAM